MIGGTKKIDSILLDFIVENNLEDDFYLEEIKKKFNSILSLNKSKSIELNGFSKGHLILKSDSSAWREELKLRRAKIKDELNKSINREIIKTIEIR